MQKREDNNITVLNGGTDNETTHMRRSRMERENFTHGKKRAATTGRTYDDDSDSFTRGGATTIEELYYNTYEGNDYEAENSVKLGHSIRVSTQKVRNANDINESITASSPSEKTNLLDTKSIKEDPNMLPMDSFEENSFSKYMKPKEADSLQDIEHMQYTNPNELSIIPEEANLSPIDKSIRLNHRSSNLSQKHAFRHNYSVLRSTGDDTDYSKDYGAMQMSTAPNKMATTTAKARGDVASHSLYVAHHIDEQNRYIAHHIDEQNRYIAHHIDEQNKHIDIQDGRISWQTKYMLDCTHQLEAHQEKQNTEIVWTKNALKKQNVEMEEMRCVLREQNVEMEEMRCVLREQNVKMEEMRRVLREQNDEVIGIKEIVLTQGDKMPYVKGKQDAMMKQNETMQNTIMQQNAKIKCMEDGLKGYKKIILSMSTAMQRFMRNNTPNSVLSQQHRGTSEPKWSNSDKENQNHLSNQWSNALRADFNAHIEK